METPTQEKRKVKRSVVLSAIEVKYHANLTGAVLSIVQDILHDMEQKTTMKRGEYRLTITLGFDPIKNENEL